MQPPARPATSSTLSRRAAWWIPHGPRWVCQLRGWRENFAQFPTPEFDRTSPSTTSASEKKGRTEKRRDEFPYQMDPCGRLKVQICLIIHTSLPIDGSFIRLGAPPSMPKKEVGSWFPLSVIWEKSLFNGDPRALILPSEELKLIPKQEE